MAVTTYEKGIEKGADETLRWTVLTQLEERFGRVPQKSRRKIEALTTEQLRGLVPKLVRAESLAELGL